MKNIDKIAFKKAIEYVKHSRNKDCPGCIICACADRNNRLHLPCSRYIEIVGGFDVWEKINEERTGCSSHIKAIKYILNKSRSIDI